MISIIPNALSKYVFYPFWDVYDRSVKLKELRRLEREQSLALEEKRNQQWQRAKSIVAYAYQHCDFYRRRPRPALNSWEDLRHIPLLTKTDVRNNTDALISREFDRSQLVSAKTGGSTGTSLSLYYDERCQQLRSGAALYTDRWSLWDLGCPIGSLWGNPPIPRGFKAHVRLHCLDRVIYLDTVCLTDASMRRFIEQLFRARVHHLFGHSHSLFILAKFLKFNGIRDLDIRGIVSTSMVLLPNERQLIEEVFGCKVNDRYGCEEVGLIACECEHHRGMHLNIDHLVVEFLRENGEPAQPGEEGRIVVTDLLNRAMPLIRYEIGDVGIPSAQSCSCGRSWPLMDRVTGRTADFLVRPDGSLVAGVSLVERTLTAISGLEQLQIVQEEPDRIVLNVVPDSAYTDSSEQRLLEEMGVAFGEGMRFDIVKVKSIDQLQNGKYRFSICQLDSPYQPLR